MRLDAMRNCGFDLRLRQDGSVIGQSPRPLLYRKMLLIFDDGRAEALADTISASSMLSLIIPGAK